MSNFGDKLFTEFDGLNPPEDFNFPSIEIEDIDRAVFDLFDKTIGFEIEQNGKSKKVPVIFASGERFALTRRKEAIRDKNNTLILPLISILRGDMDAGPNQHNKGTAIAYGDQPGYYVKRRLHKNDRKLQNILNKQGIKNQENVASKGNFSTSEIYPGKQTEEGRTASRRPGKNNSIYSNKNISLKEDMTKNIFEIIEVPYPKFISIKYDVVFWCQYMSQANEMLQTVFRNYQGQGHEIPMKTQNGYELLAFFSSDFSMDSNVNEFTNDERFVKYSFGITVPGYMINQRNAKGLKSQLKSFVSAPQVEFGFKDAPNKIVIREKTGIKTIRDNLDKNVLTDLKNITEVKGVKRGETSEEIEFYVQNPFTKEREVRYSKVLGKNKRTGESVISSLIIKDIENHFE
tara:strand:+ start:389 stop:1597 length:1209 start_codon:yes stop_codon:yes gene_type:complete